MQINYIEGFAGIGGFRLGFEQACAELNIESKCIFAFEKDKYARQTYIANFGEEPAGDITKIPSLEFKNVPEKYFLKAGTWKYLQKKQANKSNGYGFNIADISCPTKTMPSRYGKDGKEILVPEISRWTPYHRVAGLDEPANTITAQYGSNGGVATLIPELKKIGFVDYDKQGQKIWDINGIAQTKTALSGNFGGKTGLYAVTEIKIINGTKYIVDYSRVRKLMPRECARVMGFQDDFKIVVSDSQAYKQFGNAVVPAVVKEICKAVIKKIIFSKLGG